ncbi:type VII secretion-associated serine protease, partial [Mycobacterium sp. ITM-2017-0098]
CNQNPPPDAAVPADARGWQQVQTIVSPAWYSPLVLTVGSIAPTQGPCIENPLGYDGNPVNALQGEDGPIPISGTSFSAAYASGLAALIKQRFP